MSPAPWAAHFGLTRTPFGKSIPARDLFARQAHAEAIARISFCVVESALGVVTGDVGAGKTVALRAAVSTLDPTRHQVIYIANPAFGTRGLYVTIVRALGARPRYLKAELMAQAGDLLAAETAERHRRVVLICDEAHLMQPDQLEELRLLTNSEMDSASPFAGILAGQPTLNRQLRMGMFAALDQRVATRFTIKPMDLAESAAYLRHHLKLAGREEPLFADDAIARLHRVANGLPRALNNAAAAALIAALIAACWPPARTSSTMPAPGKSMGLGGVGFPRNWVACGRVVTGRRWWRQVCCRAPAGAVTGSRVSHGGRHVPSWVLCDLQRTGGGRVPGGAMIMACCP